MNSSRDNNTHAPKRLNSQASTSAARLVRSSRVPELSPDLQAKLRHVGMNARKAVSDGYKHETSIPGYQGLTIGPTNNKTGSFSFTLPDGSVRSSLDSSSTNSEFIQRIEKRSRQDFDEDDENDGGDTDVDEDDDKTIRQNSGLGFGDQKPIIDVSQKRFYISRNSSTS